VTPRWSIASGRISERNVSEGLYRELKVWQKGMELVETAYRVTATFPRSELYGLTSQMRRAAVSIPCNIAEGKGRKSAGAFANHLSIARGSVYELETLTEIARRLGLTDEPAEAGIHSACEEISRMLTVLRRRIEHAPRS
jgi:four helix bundle protein